MTKTNQMMKSIQVTLKMLLLVITKIIPKSIIRGLLGVVLSLICVFWGDIWLKNTLKVIKYIVAEHCFLIICSFEIRNILTKRICRELQGYVARADFINILRTAFTCSDPNRVKRYLWLNCIFLRFSESTSVKAARKTFVKLTPVGQQQFRFCKSI